MSGLHSITVNGQVSTIVALDQTELDYAERNQKDGGFWSESDRYYRPVVLLRGIRSAVNVTALSESTKAQLHAAILKLSVNGGAPLT